MTKFVSNNPIIRQLSEGLVKENLFTLILERDLSFTDEEYLECLGLLRKHENFRSAAETKITQLQSGVIETYLGKADANLNLVLFLLDLAFAQQELAWVTKVIHNQFLPADVLELIATHGNHPMLERLLENQIKMIAFPHILDLIESNLATDNFIRSQISEIRLFYLQEKSPGAQISEEEATQAVEDLQSQQKVFIPESTHVAIDPLPKTIEETLTTLQRINQMSTAERIRLALAGSKTERALLIRDPNRMVAMAVIDSPKLGIDEVGALVRNRSVAGEIISLIADNREWTKNYSICYELATNPKTPISKAMGFVKKLRDGDLRMINRDRNVSPVIRQMALNVINTKK